MIIHEASQLHVYEPVSWLQLSMNWGFLIDATAVAASSLLSPVNELE